LVVGRTGSGKSLLGNSLAGLKIKAEVHDGRIVLNPVNPLLTVSHSLTESCTRYPGAISPNNNDLTYIDFPGCGDISGDQDRAAQDIAHAYFRKEVLEPVREYKILLVVLYEDLTQKSDLIFKTLNEVAENFCNSNLSCCLVVTKTPKDIDKAAIVQEITRLSALLGPDDPAVVALQEKLALAGNTPSLKEQITNILKERLQKAGNKKTQKLLQYLIDNAQSNIAFLSKPEKLGETNDVEKNIILKMLSQIPFVKKSADVGNAPVTLHQDKIENTLRALIDEKIVQEFGEKIKRATQQEFSLLLKNGTDKAAFEQYRNLLKAAYAQLSSPLGLKAYVQKIHDAMSLPEELIEEARKYDHLLQFLNEALSEEKRVKLQRNWLEKLGHVEIFKPYLQTLENVLAEPTITFSKSTGVITVQGCFIETAQVRRHLLLGIPNDLKKIEVYAAHTLLINEDLHLPGIHLTMMAPLWIIERERKINLNGVMGKSLHDKVGIGEPGKPGNPGQNGGHFLSLGRKVSTIDHGSLEVSACGGDGGPALYGGPGANGQNGLNLNGKTTTPSPYTWNLLDIVNPEHDRQGEFGRPTIPKTGWDFHEGAQNVDGPGKVGIIGFYGNPGTPGSDGGLGGTGGLGGHGGNIHFIVLSPFKIKQEINPGKPGKDGLGGNGGKAGTHGCDWCRKVEFSPALAARNPLYPVSYTAYYRPSTMPAAADGKTNNKDKNSKGRITPTKEIDHPAEDLFRYRSFLIQSSNIPSSIASNCLQFLEKSESCKEIMAFDSVEHFIKEYQGIETLYATNSIKCLPLYLSLSRRIIQTSSTIKDQTQLNYLQWLYTALYSKIRQLNTYHQSKLVVDIKQYLEIAVGDIERLKSFEGRLVVHTMKKTHSDYLQKKIQDSGRFLKKLFEEITLTKPRLEVAINKLLQEVQDAETLLVKRQAELNAGSYEIMKDVEAIQNKRLQLIELKAKDSNIRMATLGISAIGMALGIASGGAGAVAVAGLIGGGAQTIAHITQDPHLDAKQQLERLDRAQGRLDQQIADLKSRYDQLVQYEKQGPELICKAFDEFIKNIDSFQKTLHEKQVTELEFDHFAITQVFNELQGFIKNCTKSFEAQDDFKGIINRVQEAINTTFAIYGHIQEYREQAVFSAYLAELHLAPTGGNSHPLQSEIDKLQKIIHQNLILERYCSAVAAVKQWAFPFAQEFVTFADLKPFLEKATVPDFIQAVIQKIEELKKNMDLDTATFRPYRQAIFTDVHFGIGQQPPFCQWTCTGYLKQQLLQHNEISLASDVQEFPLSAVKFKSIYLRIQCANPSNQAQLNAALQHFEVHLTHPGVSFYKFKNDIYRIVNDGNGFKLVHDFSNPMVKNDIYNVLSKDSALSPYAEWKIQLKPKQTSAQKAPNLMKIFQDDPLILQLIGQGSYVDASMAELSSVNLAPYYIKIWETKSTVDGSVAQPQESDQQFPQASNLEKNNLAEDNQNAFNQRLSARYWYQAEDIRLIQSWLFKDKSNLFNIFQPMQIGHLKEQKRMDDIQKSLAENKPVIGIMNLGNLHWVTYCIFSLNGKVCAFYKDSLGGQGEAFRDALQQRFPKLEFKANQHREQLDGWNCGVFALRNMTIIADHWNTPNFGNFAKDFTTFANFCSLEQAIALRSQDFSNAYVNGLFQDIKKYDSANASVEVACERLNLTDPGDKQSVQAILKESK
jgi:hypothetical protein